MARVLLVSSTGQLGGAERSLVELAAAINPEKYELFAVVGGGGPLVAELESLEVRTEVMEMIRLQRTVNPLQLAEYVATISKVSRSIGNMIESLGIDLVHANTDMAHVYAGEAAARAGVPCVWHSRDMLNLGPIGERMAKQAAVIIAISEAVLKHHRDAGVSEEKLTLVRNGIALARFPEGQAREDARLAARRDLSIDPFAFVAGSAGVLVPWKRHEDFIRSFAKLCEYELDDLKKRPDGPGSTVIELKGLTPARAVIFGSDLFEENGRHVFELKKLADELIGERLAFPGWQNDLASRFPALDVFISTSENEPFGRSIVEAMASGLPVVATDSGGKRETIVDKETGILVPQGDIVAIARAMHALKRDPEKRQSMGEAAHRRAFEAFSVEQTAKEVVSVYELLVPGTVSGEPS